MSIFKTFSLLLPLASFSSFASAADCTTPNQVVYSKFAIDMMWSLREEYCNGHWDANFKLYIADPPGRCNGKAGLCFGGWWYGRGHPSQQACWDVTAQIIEQCMRKDSYDVWNGGRWSYGNEYQEGWHYTIYNSKLSAPKKAEELRYHTLMNGTVVELDGAAVLVVDDAAPKGYRVEEVKF